MQQEWMLSDLEIDKIEGAIGFTIYEMDKLIAITQAKKLLKYLISTAAGGHLAAEYDGFDRDAIGLHELEEMLKQLEERNVQAIE